MRELDKIAEALFEKIRSRFESISIGDENAKATQDPENARFFNFDYVSQDGTNLGNVTISLIDENSIKTYYSKNITDNLNDEQKQEWFDFLKGLRMFAKRNMMNFDTRDISRQTLNIKDLRQQSKSDSSLTADEVEIKESRMYGTSRSSYDRVGETRIIVRHSKAVDEACRGSRTRNIESIFVETPDGERFRLPFNNLAGARAIGQHIAQGGAMFDERANHITEMVKEMAAMRTFVRATGHQVFEDPDTQDMVEAAKKRYHNIRKGLKSMRGPRGYGFYWGGWPGHGDGGASDGGVGESEIKEKFTRRVFDERLAEALPYVQRAYIQHLADQKNSMVDEFERWTEEVDKFDQIRKDAADSLEKSINKQSDDRIAKLKQIKNEPFMAQVGRKIIGGVKGAIKGFSGKEGIKEGTWALPDTDDEIRDLKDLMSKPLKVGVDAVEATSALYDLVGDDKLFDILGNLAEKNPEANIWDEPEVQKRFEELGMVDAIEGHNQRNPEPIAQTTVRPEVQPTESIETVTNEDLAMLKWLSGIQK